VPVGLVADLGEKLLDLADRIESVALPAAVADAAGRLDGAFLHALQRRRRGRGALQEPFVVVGQRPLQGFQAGRRKLGSDPFPPDLSPTFHGSVPLRGVNRWLRRSLFCRLLAMLSINKFS